ncbi:hypothetical protein M413DRAFT_448354 [Hebeloma cylindrosporum]|uniref:Flavin-nucleotide-binding protein n=1 Tax=Hebeloma cylindrosporum TaxID=76867 RepID=A0A0C3BLF7_HEBCY|nr:hypothetical protein M413DRAFT_448354 [Hebeloma cylindrosporum h7]
MSEREIYEATPRSTVNRLKQRAVYDHETVHAIIDSAPVLHVSFNPTWYDDDPFPTILPMLGCTGSYTPADASETSPPAVYLHGHSASRLMKLPSNPLDDSLPGVPVCVAATHIDGLVLALTPFNHSCNYRSAIVHGWAVPVTDYDEKMYALTLITDSMVPSRWSHTRIPPTEVEMKSTGVIRVNIVSASAKIRAHTAGDDAKDLADTEMRRRVWAGVVPMNVVYGEPVPTAGNLVEEVPRYIEEWRERENDGNVKYSREVASRNAPKK